jgi:acyl carrier protein
LANSQSPKGIILNTETRLQTFIVDEILMGMDGDEPVSAETDLLLSGLVDSLGVMRLVSYMEETFNIAIAPVDVTIENFRTIADMSRYIDQQRVHQ